MGNIVLCCTAPNKYSKCQASHELDLVEGSSWMPLRLYVLVAVLHFTTEKEL
jgi:hypothetical protein